MINCITVLHNATVKTLFVERRREKPYVSDSTQGLSDYKAKTKAAFTPSTRRDGVVASVLEVWIELMTVESPRVWTNFSTDKWSCVASAAWMHPSVVAQFCNSLCCSANHSTVIPTMTTTASYRKNGVECRLMNRKISEWICGRKWMLDWPHFVVIMCFIITWFTN